MLISRAYTQIKAAFISVQKLETVIECDGIMLQIITLAPVLLNDQTRRVMVGKAMIDLKTRAEALIL